MIFTNQIKKNIGFTLIEVLIACSIISVSMFALMETAQKGLILSNQALKKSQASLLLEEGAEAVKSIRDNSWTTIDGLVLDTPYYLFFNSNTKLWELNNMTTTGLSGHIPTYPIDGVFTRTVTLSAVNRNASDDISASGENLDSRTKKIIITVNWILSGVSNSKSLTFYIADIFN